MDLIHVDVLGYCEYDMMDFKTLVDHYIMMERVDLAGGLRKELTAEICVFMHIKWIDPTYDPIKAMMLAQRVKLAVIEIRSIPF